jgi:hypothetical protein
MRRLTLATLALCTVVPGPVYAHPGHALHGYAVHYLVDPTHGGMLPVAVVLGAGVLAWLLGNRRPRPAAAPARKGERKGGDRKRRD